MTQLHVPSDAQSRARATRTVLVLVIDGLIIDGLLVYAVDETRGG